MEIEIKKFEDLSSLELYEILKMRVEVFIVEQKCVYNDLDNEDKNCFHLIAKDKKEIVSYLRILKKSNQEISFGRVLVSRNERGKGYAKKIIEEAMSFINKKWKEKTIIIQAQSYLQNFYESFGFVAISDEFLEDAIPHIWMKHQALF